MKSFEIHLDDIQRILFGEVPPLFFLEIIVRTFVVYVILMVSMRLMGKRMSSELQRNELAALVTLAAAIGVPMHEPMRGLLPAIVIALVVIVIQQLVAKRAAISQKFETISQGNMSVLVADGVLQLKTMEHSKIPRVQVFAHLRGSGVKHLGEVKRLYLESDGSFSLLRSQKETPGLCILPEWDKDFIGRLQIRHKEQVCNTCGCPREDNAELCDNCQSQQWTACVV
jgi:uncharacterized membrane protein YcaP (DUF421 family)